MKKLISFLILISVFSVAALGGIEPLKISFQDLKKLKITGYRGYEDFKKRLTIPQDIKSLNGKLVTIRGYMLPLDNMPPLTKHFLLLKIPVQCCYFCTAPEINEMVEVLMAGKGVKGDMNKIAQVSGIFEVGLKESSELMINSIYRIKAEEVKIL
jgi:hypothetical protein